MIDLIGYWFALTILVLPPAALVLGLLVVLVNKEVERITRGKITDVCFYTVPGAEKLCDIVIEGRLPRSPFVAFPIILTAALSVITFILGTVEVCNREITYIEVYHAVSQWAAPYVGWVGILAAVSLAYYLITEAAANLYVRLSSALEKLEEKEND